MTDDVCKTCRFFDGRRDRDGLCRRYPPVVFAEGRSYWPIVGKYDTCGEFVMRGPTLVRDCPGCGGPAKQCLAIARSLGFGCAHTPLKDYYV